jgi:hypothetical protein
MKKGYQEGGVPPAAGDGDGGGGDIDLGQQPEGLGPGMADMPTGGGVGGGPAAMQYPSVMLQGDEGLSKIPDSGRSIIHHAVVSRRVHTPQHGKHKGKQRHEVEIHLKSIRPIRGYKKAESKSKPSDDERAMKKLMGDQDDEGEEE